MIDGTDLEIVKILQENARTSNAEIARRVGLAPSAILERIRKLESRGVVSGFTARLDPEAAGLELLAFLFVRAEDGPGDTGTAERLAELPQVLEVHHIAGEDCYLIKVRTAGTRDLHRLLKEQIGAISTVRSTRTTIVLSTIKETCVLPLPEPEERPATTKGKR